MKLFGLKFPKHVIYKDGNKDINYQPVRCLKYQGSRNSVKVEKVRGREKSMEVVLLCHSQASSQLYLSLNMSTLFDKADN